MKLAVKFKDFKQTKFYYEYMHEVVSRYINHNTDGLLISELLDKYGKEKPIRQYKGSLLALYRILTANNFDMGYPLIQAYNPAARLIGDKLEMLVRLGSFNPGRTFLGVTYIDDFGGGLINEESGIPDKSFRTRLFLRARLPYESVEDPRYSPVDNKIFFVTVLRGPGFPIHEPVITWMVDDGHVAPIMYRDIVLSDNRDSFKATEKVIAIRPNYKFAYNRNVTALGYFNKDELNVVEEVFTHRVFIPRKEEEKTGGSLSIKINRDQYLFIYHVVYRGIRGLKGEGTTGTYINYGAIINNEGEIIGEIRKPLTPLDYPYSGQRPGTVFASGGVILDGPTADKMLPGVNNTLKDYDKLVVLFAGLDDEAMAVFVQDLDTLMENVIWY